MSLKELLVTNRGAVRKVFEKSEQDVEQDMEIIRKWVKSQPHIPEIPSDNMIELFLTVNKYSIEMTKEEIDMYYTIRALLPEVFLNSHPLDPRMLGVSEKMGIFVPLPRPTEDNHRVFIFKLTENSDDFNLDVFLSHIGNICEMKAQYDITIGDIFFIDHANLKMGHITKLTPSYLIKWAAILQNSLSNRIQGMHVINYPPFIDVLLALGKRMLKPRLFSRIYLHNSIEEFYEHVPRKILPKDYGGDEPPLEELAVMWNKFMVANPERFDKLAEMKVREELRPTPLKNDEILGYHGNFKKLDID